MKKSRVTFLFLILLLSCASSIAQADTALPRYGKYKDYSEFVRKNVNYPGEAIENGITGRIIYEFIIQENGCIDSIKIVSNTEEILNNEVIKVLKSTDCKWTVGKINNIPTALKLSSFVEFSIR